MRRRRLVVCAVLVGAVALVLGAGHAAATLPGETAIVDATCSQENVTALTLRVEYHGDGPVTVTPHVWSARQHVQFSWGPDNLTLQPGSQTLRIEAADERAFIHEAPIQVWLADGQRRMIANDPRPRCT